MKKGINGIRLGSLLMLCVCLVALWYFPALLQKKEEVSSRRAQRQLVTVWIYGDKLNASHWVQQQAAAYQKKHAGVNVWVRTVTEGDIRLLEEDYQHAAPDLLLFMAGEEIAPEWTQQVHALCMAGYALVAHAQGAATVAPTSLFGVTPAPVDTPLATPVPRESWPQKISADDALGAYFLQEIDAPKGALLLSADEVQQAFVQCKVDAALLSTLQIRSLSAQGVGMELICAAPGSDLVLYGAVMQEAQAAAEEVLQYFLSEEAQRALADKGLISPQGVRLYGAGTPILQAVERALQAGWLPDAFLWPQEKMERIHIGQMLYAAK